MTVVQSLQIVLASAALPPVVLKLALLDERDHIIIPYSIMQLRALTPGHHSMSVILCHNMDVVLRCFHHNALQAHELSICVLHDLQVTPMQVQLVGCLLRYA